MNARTSGLVWLHPELARLPASPRELARASQLPSDCLQAWDGSRLRVVGEACDAAPGELLLLSLSSRGFLAAACLNANRFKRADGPAAIPYFDDFDCTDARVGRSPSSDDGLFPGCDYDDSVRRDLRELVRVLHPSRALLFRALEHFAASGIELGAASSNPPWSANVPKNRPLVLAVEGVDGSGKSSHVAALGEHLSAGGLRVARLKIFRHGVFHRTVTDLVRRCHGERRLHLWRLERFFKIADSLKYFHAVVEPTLSRVDVALFDRYVSTHVAAATGRLFDDVGAHQVLSVYPRPDRVYLLDLPVDDALSRLGARDERTIDENRFMLERYRRRLLVQARREGFVILDARRSFAENQEFIRADVARLTSEARF